MQWRDPAQVVVPRIRADALEEGATSHAHFFRYARRSSSFSSSGTSVAVNSSILRPFRRRPSPLARRLRTHCVSPRGATM